MDFQHQTHVSHQPEASDSESIIQEFHEFNLVEFIGHGGFGQVYLVQKKNGKDVNALYALKEVVINTNDTAEEIQKCNEKIKNERKVLKLVQNFRFCTQMMYAFKIDDKYYLALEYYSRGDLRTYLEQHPQLEYNTARLCAAEIFLAIEFMHSKGIVYRDLKPENILIDKFGHLALTDFGLAQQLTQNEAVHGCCGTYEYMAPETFRTPLEGFRHSVDFWSLGCVMYQMLTGRVPFEVDDDFINDSRASEWVTWHILYTEPCYDFNHFRTYPIARRFLEQLLDKTPSQRLGSGPEGMVNIKTHPFFHEINWQYVFYKQYNVLGMENVERTDNEPIVYCHRKTFRKQFIKNDYDFVSRSLRNSAKPLTMTSKLTKILGPSERSFDALYEQQRETKLQLYSKQFDCHLLLPKSKMKAVMKRWMTANPNDI